MRKNNHSKLAPIKRGVVVDPHRGIVYFDDSACRIKKYHNKGYRNIYSVILTYYAPMLARKKVIRLDYGQFHQAHGRYFIETGNDCSPNRMSIREIRLLVSTFHGTKLINEDVLRCVEYGKRKLRNIESPIGEILY
jgi:hypothetical protein